MNHVTIASLVRDILRQSRPTNQADKEAGALRASQAFGVAKVESLPELLNFGVLAHQMRDRVVVHALRPGVCRLIDDTDLRSLPHDPPALLRGPWILESRQIDRGEALFGSTVTLAGYTIGETIYLIGLQSTGSCMVAPWAPAWEEGELPEGMRVERSTLVDQETHSDYAAWAREAARFALVAALILESEAVPVRTSDDRDKPIRGTAGQQTEWVTRHITLGQSRSSGTPGSGGEREDDAALSAVNVRGHLKRQRHGPGNELTKWIYVAEYSARRWVSPRPLRVVVGGGNGS